MTLGLAWFDQPGLSCSLSNIPLEYYTRAIRWPRRQPHVDPPRVWIHSGSRGTDAELLVAAHWRGSRTAPSVAPVQLGPEAPLGR